MIAAVEGDLADAVILVTDDEADVGRQWQLVQRRGAIGQLDADDLVAARSRPLDRVGDRSLARV